MRQKIDTGLYAYDCVGYFGNTCGVPLPEWRHMARFSWETNWKIVLSVGWRMIGPVTNDELSPEDALAVPENEALLKINDIDKIPAYNYIDLGATYKLCEGRPDRGRHQQRVRQGTAAGARDSQLNDYGAGFYGTYDSLGRYLHASIQFTF